MTHTTHSSQKIPKLRFREFQAEWEEKKIWKISDVRDGTHDSPKYQDEGFPLLTSKNLLSNWRIDYENVSYISQLDYENINKRSKVNIGDILFGMIWSIGNPVIVKRGDFAIKNVALIKEKEEIQNIFLIHYLNSDPIIRQFYRVNIWGAQKFIALWVIRDLPIRFPSLTEQKKIASFLSSVDTRIEQLREKKSLLEEYKKWVMQKIFAREIRFKEENGKEYGEWEEKKLGEIWIFKTSSIDKKTIEWEKEVFMVNYMDVYKHRDINNTTKDNLMIVTAKDSQIAWSDLKKWDILFTPSSETPDDIWHSIVIFEDLDNTVYSYHVMRFRPSIKLDLLYAHYFCNIPEVLAQLTKFSTGSTRFTISVSNFSKVKIKLPTFPEQQKIASFLSEIDSKIQSTSEQLEEAEKWKKGLLQGMFV